MPTRNINTDLKINGSIELDGILYDAGASAGTSGQVLSSTSTGTDWVTLSEISGVDGTGTANYLSKWLDANTITNSLVYDNGTNVGIGTTIPLEKLHVGGDIRVGDGGASDYNRVEFTRYGGAVVGAVGWHTDNNFYVGGHPLYGPTAGNIVRVYGFGSDIRLGDSVNGDVLTVDATNGNVGIGTTSPNSLLQVGSGSSNSPSSIASLGGSANDIMSALSLVNTLGNAAAGQGVALDFHVNASYSPTGRIATIAESTGTPAALAFYTYNSGLNEKMRITSSGNVGIGTTGPNSPLSVQSNSGGGAARFIGRSSDSISGLEFFNNAQNSSVYLQGNGSWFRSRADGGFHFAKGVTPTTSDTNGFTINGLNVGIGTNNPAVELDFGSTTGKAFHLYTNSVDYYGFNMLQYDGGPFSTNIFSGNGGEIKLRTASGTSTQTTRLTVTAAGNVGIGTPDPENRLHISTSTTDTSSQLMVQNGSSGDAAIKFNISGQSNVIGIDNSDGNKFKISGFSALGTYDRLTIDTSGNVGINTTSPSYQLDVNGGILAGGKVTYEKAAGSLDTTGYAVAGLVTGSNGNSSGFTFTCFGNTGDYQRVVYSCYNAAGTWNTQKVIDEGTNDFDVTASANGTTITFTFKSRSGTKNYTPRVSVEAVGHSINSTYA
jgi:hypothetical protein